MTSVVTTPAVVRMTPALMGRCRTAVVVAMQLLSGEHTLQASIASAQVAVVVASVERTVVVYVYTEHSVVLTLGQIEHDSHAVGCLTCFISCLIAAHGGGRDDYRHHQGQGHHLFHNRQVVKVFNILFLLVHIAKVRLFPSLPK